MNSNNKYDQIELFIDCKDFKGSDDINMQIRVHELKQDDWLELGRTEALKQLNPSFLRAVSVNFVFETIQPLLFEIWNITEPNRETLISKISATVGQIIGARKQTFEADIYGKDDNTLGKLVVYAEKSEKSNNIITWKWSAVKVLNTDGLFGKSDPFLRFFRRRHGGYWIQVHETEFIKDTLNPVWEEFSITDGKICGSIYDPNPIKIECWDNSKTGKHNYIGTCEIQLKDLQEGKEFPLQNPKEKKPGVLKLLSFSTTDTPKFSDFLRGGEQLNFSIAIDFTSSNGNPNLPTSLHSRKPNFMNEYESAISAVGQIILNYDSDQLVPMFGFGGNPNFKNLKKSDVSHCFPCNGSEENPQTMGMKGIMDTYNFALENVILSGPTYFQPIINEAVKASRKNKESHADIYTVLLILTDGEIHDMKETINTLVKSGDLPLSIIIVGVGKADFKKMEILDGDKGLQNEKGEKVARDFVQFVPFRQHQNNMTLLAEHVLAEIPEQLVKYKAMVGKKPKAAPKS